MSWHTNSHILPTTYKSNERLLGLVIGGHQIGISPLSAAAVITCCCSLSEKLSSYCISCTFMSYLLSTCTTSAFPPSIIIDSSITQVTGHLAGPPDPSPIRHMPQLLSPVGWGRIVPTHVARRSQPLVGASFAFLQKKKEITLVISNSRTNASSI